ncbi:pyruvate kinase, partial [uncultured Muriicola sp.]|uniref:pyruvate kinase n=1 Tax=uncultured Muriicola sp. TaxID=1583102 RepID=UPI002608B011
MAEISKKEVKIRWLIQEISVIIERLEHFEAKYSAELSKIHPNFIKTARNLIHYRALRKEDITAVQNKLANMGLSRLDKPEGHVMASLLASKAILESLLNNSPIKKHKAELTFKKSNRLGKSNAKSLLGYRSKGRRTRIMVTLPTEVAHNYQMAHDMIANGMNCARINCAHDSEKEWRLMIGHVRQASKKLKKKCKITMDLGGPKVRTGPLKAGPRVKRFRPTKDVRGIVIKNCEIWMGPEDHQGPNLAYLPVALSGLEKLKVGDRLFFSDARNKKREFTITKKTANGCIAVCGKTTFLETGSKLFTDEVYSSSSITIGELPRVDQFIMLHTGDFLRLRKDVEPGEPAHRDKDDNLISHAHISCTLGEVFEQVKEGEPVFFDDGKIKGVIRQVEQDEILVEILNARKNGSKLRADKGINFPGSKLDIRGLTDKDKKDLVFVIQNADTVNVSFVNRKRDVKDLIIQLEKLNAPDNFGIILKIETQSGFNNLAKILLEAMKRYPVGVMIARGDLAIECGWDNIGRVQREILSLCRAAHVPDIWATQVLENLSKQGIPSRAEMTDAAMAQRTDCVMLNKGPYILQAIKLLDTIFKDMELYQGKNVRLWPAMEKAKI